MAFVVLFIFEYLLKEFENWKGKMRGTISPFISETKTVIEAYLSGEDELIISEIMCIK